MTLTMTAEQQQAINTKPGQRTRLLDPLTNSMYVLVPEAEFEAIEEIVEDELRQRTIHAIGLKNAIRRMSEEP